MTTPRRFAVFALFVAGCGGRSLYLENDDSAEPGAGAPGSSNGGSAGDTSGGGSGATSGGADRGGTGGDDAGGSQNLGGTDNGGTSPGNGGTSPGTGGSSGSRATGGSAGSVDANCHPGLAVSGATCTMDCSGVPCGFADIGLRSCECTGGYYSGCHCPRPPDYLGAHTAPPCDTPDGRALPLRHEPCDEEWAQCIGNDPVEGSIPRGCVCLENPLNGDSLTWFCGSTNRWFLPE
jgi:hypothetical protein